MEWQILTSWGFPSLRIGDDDGLTILIRDRAQEDKVVKVIEPLDTVHLTYDFENEDGRLKYIRTEWDNYEAIGAVSQLHKLFYEPYLTSEGVYESVLKKVQQITKVVKVYMNGIKIPRLSQEKEKLYTAIYTELSNMDSLNIEQRGTDQSWEWKNLKTVDMKNQQIPLSGIY